jgi:hypothetical protein
MVAGSAFPRLWRPGREADHSPPSPYNLVVCTGTTLPLPLPLFLHRHFPFIFFSLYSFFPNFFHFFIFILLPILRQGSDLSGSTSRYSARNKSSYTLFTPGCCVCVVGHVIRLCGLVIICSTASRFCEGTWLLVIRALWRSTLCPVLD